MNMRKTFAALAVSATAAYAALPAASANAQSLVIVPAGVTDINLRTGPGVDHTIISPLRPGDTLALNGRCVDADDVTSRYKFCPVWTKDRFGNRVDGWVSSTGLQRTGLALE